MLLYASLTFLNFSSAKDLTSSPRWLTLSGWYFTAILLNAFFNSSSEQFDDISKIFGDPDFTLSATSSSTGAFTFSIADGSVASVSGNTVTIQGAGSTIVTVNQAADSNYNSATATMTLTVVKANPTITFDDITKVLSDPDFSLSASSNSSGAFTYSIANSGVATVSGASVSLEGLGSTTVTVNQAADNNYNSGTASMTLTVNKPVPLIDFNDITSLESFEILSLNWTKHNNDDTWHHASKWLVQKYLRNIKYIVTRSTKSNQKEANEHVTTK